MLTRETIESLGFTVRPRNEQFFIRELSDGRVFEVGLAGDVWNGDDEHPSDTWLGHVANDAELIALCRAIPGWDNEKRDG